MATVKNIDVAVRANTSQFEGGMRKSSDSLEGFAKKIPLVNSISSSVAGMNPVAAGAAASFLALGAAFGAATAAASRLWAVMQPVLASVDAAAKAASRLGVSTASLQGLQFGAGLAGIDAGTITTGLERMSRSISMAAVGNKALQSAFLQLGVSVDRLQQLRPDEAFLHLGDAIARINNPMDRLRLTMEIFGRSGAPLVNFLQQGSEAMREQQREAVKLRLTNTELDAINFQQLNDNLERLTKSFTGLANVVTQLAAPAITSLFEDLTKLIVEPTQAIDDMASSFTGAVSRMRSSIGGNIAETVSAALGGGIFAKATVASQTYFDSVSERAAQLANQVNESQRGTNAFTPEQVLAAQQAMEERQKAMQAARERQMAFVQKQLALQRETVLKAIEAERDARTKAFEKAMAERQKLIDEAARTTESLKTPFEKFVDEIARLRSLQRGGLISSETFSRGFAAAREAFSTSLTEDVQSAFSQAEPPAALERFTQQAFSAFQKAQGRNEQDKLLAESKRHTKALDALVRRGIVLAEAKI